MRRLTTTLALALAFLATSATADWWLYLTQAPLECETVALEPAGLDFACAYEDLNDDGVVDGDDALPPVFGPPREASGTLVAGECSAAFPATVEGAYYVMAGAKTWRVCLPPGSPATLTVVIELDPVVFADGFETGDRSLWPGGSGG